MGNSYLTIIAAILLFCLTGCEVYQSPGRQCIKNPSHKNCGNLTINFSKSVRANAQKHCLFNKEDVTPIREEQAPQEVNGLKIWRNTNFLNIEVHHTDQVFNCVFEPVKSLEEEVYVSLTYELVTWLTQEQSSRLTEFK